MAQPLYNQESTDHNPNPRSYMNDSKTQADEEDKWEVLPPYSQAIEKDERARGSHVNSKKISRDITNTKSTERSAKRNALGQNIRRLFKKIERHDIHTSQNSTRSVGVQTRQAGPKSDAFMLQPTTSIRPTTHRARGLYKYCIQTHHYPLQYQSLDTWTGSPWYAEVDIACHDLEAVLSRRDS